MKPGVPPARQASSRVLLTTEVSRGRAGGQSSVPAVAGFSSGETGHRGHEEAASVGAGTGSRIPAKRAVLRTLASRIPTQVQLSGRTLIGRRAVRKLTSAESPWKWGQELVRLFEQEMARQGPAATLGLG